MRRTSRQKNAMSREQQEFRDTLLELAPDVDLTGDPRVDADLVWESFVEMQDEAMRGADPEDQEYSWSNLRDLFRDTRKDLEESLAKHYLSRRNPMSFTENAIEAIAAHTGEEVDDIQESYDFGWGDGKVFDVASAEYLIFPSSEKSRRAALAYVKETLKEEPEIFNQDFLRHHLMMRPTDIRIMAGEEGDSYAENFDGEEAIAEAEMESLLEDEIAAETEAYEEAEAAYQAAPPGRESDYAGDKMSEASDELDDARDKAIEELSGRAKEFISETHADRVASLLEDDPLQYFEDMGMGDVGDLLDRGLLVVDAEAAAEDAVDTDGASHFLSRYDGEEYELDGGLVAYRIN